MLLSARMMQVSDVNNFTVVPQLSWTNGDTLNCYFQLIDLSKKSVAFGNYPQGERYVPAAGATLTIDITNIDSAKAISDRVCVQPFVGDASIWYFAITASDDLSGPCQLKLKLTQSSVVTRGSVQTALSVTSVDNL